MGAGRDVSSKRPLNPALVRRELVVPWVVEKFLGLFCLEVATNDIFHHSVSDVVESGCDFLEEAHHALV